MAGNSTLKVAGPLRVGYLSADPATADNGTLYYNTSTNKIRQYLNGSWGDISTASLLTSTFRLLDSTDQTKQIAFNASGISTGQTRTITVPDANVNLGLVATALQTSQLGAANGVAGLDSTGKVPTSQLPASVLGTLEYQGTWSAAAGTLPSGATQGQYWVISAAGTINSHVVAVGDWIVNNGSSSAGDLTVGWDYIDQSAKVSAVNGQTGAVTLTTDNVAEGATNEYFTTARAQAAAVENSLAASTVMAPSATAVNTALAAKLSSVSQDTAPALGGDLALSGHALVGLVHREDSGSRWIEEEYIDATTLTSATSNGVAFTLNLTTFAAMELTYLIREASTLRVRHGRLRVVTDGTNVAVVDDYSETADVDTAWSASIASNTLSLQYTTTNANNKTMRADIKRFQT